MYLIFQLLIGVPALRDQVEPSLSQPPAFAAPTKMPLLYVAFGATIAAAWSLSHRHEAFAQDGDLYAVQALARIYPGLRNDIFLSFTSQDKYSLFSVIYASLIGRVGIQTAELLLFVTCSFAFIVGAGLLVRKLDNSLAGWLAAAIVAVGSGQYGAYGVFSYLENYLSARSLAQALICASFVCFAYSRKISALMIAISAMLIHPIMALPGLLLLVALLVPLRIAARAAGIGVFVAALIAFLGANTSSINNYATVMSADWLSIVQQRSQFLFLQFWRVSDWELVARAFVSLTLSALVTESVRIRDICFASMLVGAAGLAIAFIAGTIGPVAVLVQGQAWRWVWVTDFMGLILAAPTALTLWKQPNGRACAIFLVLGWTWKGPGIDLLAYMDASLIYWLVRERISGPIAMWLAWAAAALIGVSVAVNVDHWVHSPATAIAPGWNGMLYAKAQTFFKLGIAAPLFCAAFFIWQKQTRSALACNTGLLLSLSISAIVVPASLHQAHSLAAPSATAEFIDWRNAIPEQSNVLLLPFSNTAAFMWLTLHRPSYTSVDQSSGVVFSRETAMEIQRRSEVLLPLGPANWRLKSVIDSREAGQAINPPVFKPLTADVLIRICSDPQLGFVISKDDVGLEPIKHLNPGPFKNWSLYNCSAVARATKMTSDSLRPHAETK